MKHKKTIKTLIFASLFTIALITSILQYNFTAGSNLSQKYVLLTNVCSKIKLEVTTAHLWFEEVLSGDKNEKIEDVYKHLDKANEYLNVIFQEDIYQEELTLAELLDNTLATFEEFKKTTIFRYEAIANSKSGSDLDQQYDAGFLQLISELNELSSTIDNIVLKKIEFYQLIHYFSMILVILSILIMSYLMMRIFNEKNKSAALLESTNIALENQKELYELVSKNSINGILLIDIERNKFIEANAYAIKLLGYESESEILNLSPADISPEFQHDGQSSASKSIRMNALAVKNGSHRFEWEHLNKNAQKFWVEVILTPIIIDKKSLLHVVWIDIKERKEFEKEILFLNKNLEKRVTLEVEKNRQKDQLLLEESNLAQKKLSKANKLFDANVIASNADLKGTIIYASQALCDISGYTQAELLGKPHSVLKSPDTPKEVFTDLWKTITAGQIWEGELKNSTKDGGFYWVYATIIPDKDENGVITGYQSIRQNISADKAKAEFLANMSHEIRTPLNAVMGFVDFLKEESKGRKIAKYVDIIESSSKSLLKIIEDILDFSKIESGKLEIDKIDFNTKEEFEIITHLFDGVCSKKNILLTLNIDEEMPKNIHTDPIRIKQVVSNLLSNAIKFSPENTNILVDITFKNKFLSISVKDQGIGIAKDKLTHIFDPFSQEDTSTTRKYGGTGLGLSISRELVKLLGGELKVKSEVGIGSDFYFSIPVSVAQENIDTKTYTKDLTFEDKKLLLVEDNEANQIFMKVIFNKLKMDFKIANDGNEAISMFKEEKYDLIFMDENMPNKNGIAATKEIREYEKENSLKHTPIIALTANAIKGDREKFLNAGMDEYLTKPINKQKIIEVLAQIFGT